MTIRPVDLLLHNFPPRSHSISQLIQDLNRRVPIDASIGNTDTLLEA